MSENLSKRHQSGFSLIEILISLVILSIGFLGLAKLQLTSLRYSKSADYRSAAMWLAGDIIDRMRANQDAAEGLENLTFVYRTDIDGGSDYAVGNAPNAINCAGTSATCTTTQMADFDIDQWKTALSSTLPLGDGSIARAESDGRKQFTITVQWDDTRGEGDVTTLSLEAEL